MARALVIRKSVEASCNVGAKNLGGGEVVREAKIWGPPNPASDIPVRNLAINIPTHFFRTLLYARQYYLRTEVRGDFNIHGTKYF